MEQWKKLNVIGPEAEVSSMGRIRRRGTCLGQKLKDWVIVTPYRDRKGFLYVTFRGDGKQQNRYVHKLVAENFIENPNNYGFIRFKDDVIDHTAADNLAWSDHPREYSNSGKGIKLSSGDISAINTRLWAGESQSRIAADFKVHPSLISHIKAGRKWK